MSLIQVTHPADDRIPEQVTSYEVGYRMQVAERFWFDVAGFYSRYDDILTLEPEAAFQVSPELLRDETRLKNMAQGETAGGELAAQWHVRRNWVLKGAYSYFTADIDLKPGGAGRLLTDLYEDGNPRHTMSLLSSTRLTPSLDADVWLRAVDSLDGLLHIAGYTELDLRLAWRPSDRLEVALVGRNLLHDSHKEFVAPFDEYAVPRSAYAKVTLNF
jgi:iron complex outermembrane receptor protein